MNRIKSAIDRMTQTIKDKGLPQEKLDEMHKSLDMPLEDFCKFQEMKSVASMDGTLSLEEAQTVYALLGETPDTFNGRTLAEKYVLSQLLAELCQRRIKGRQTA